MSIITQEQVIELEGNSRFQGVVKQFVRDFATYITQQNGTTGNLAGLTPENWAKQRFIAKGIALHPNSQNNQEWVSQVSMLLKGQNVWVAGTPENPGPPVVPAVSNADATITAMIASGKFEELVTLTYTLRASVIEF